MRKRRLTLNAVSSLLLQIISIVFGLIIPKMIIASFGSNINGLNSSIAQFLSYITLFEAGIGGVSRALLYKPLAEGDEQTINGVYKSTDIFFKKLGLQYIVYAVALSLVYPTLVNSTYEILFTGSLILIMAAGTFAQYYFGIPNSILLQADQRNYITTFVQILFITINGIMTILMIHFGYSIHAVRFFSAIIYILRPIILMIYVRKKYNIITDVIPTPLPALQKKAGIFHNVAWFLRTNSNVAILTFLSNLSSVSIFSIYYLISQSLSSIVTSFASGAEAMFGNIMATEDIEYSRKMFGWYISIMNMIAVIVFSTAINVIIPFIKLYTRSVTDANYVVPLLGIFILFSEFLFCARKPYHDVITASGHFNETKISAINEVLINIGLAIVLVWKYGIAGVGFASVAAIGYRMIYFIFYVGSNIIYFPVVNSLKHIIVSVAQGLISIGIYNIVVTSEINNYFIWLAYAVFAFALSSLIVIITNLLIYPNETRRIWGFVLKSISNKK